MIRLICSIAAMAFFASAAFAAMPDDSGAAPSSEPIASDNGDVSEQMTVAETLKSLKARKDLTITTHPDGWIIADDEAHNIVWSFTPKGNEAYPAVVRRDIVRKGSDFFVTMNVNCEASKAACSKLTDNFEQANAKIQKFLNDARKAK